MFERKLATRRLNSRRVSITNTLRKLIEAQRVAAASLSPKLPFLTTKEESCLDGCKSSHKLLQKTNHLTVTKTCLVITNNIHTYNN